MIGDRPASSTHSCRHSTERATLNSPGEPLPPTEACLRALAEAQRWLLEHYEEVSEETAAEIAEAELALLREQTPGKTGDTDAKS